MLKGKVELAYLNWLKVAGLPAEFAPTGPDDGDVMIGWNIYRGHDGDEKRLPCLIIEATDGDSEAAAGSGSGTRFMTVTATIQSPVELENEAIDPEEDHAARVEAVYRILKDDELPTNLSNTVDDFYVYSPILETGSSSSIAGRAFTDSFTFRLFCSPEDLE